VIDAAWPAPNTELKATTVIGAVVTVVGVWLSGRDELGARSATKLARAARRPRPR
jgi:hypothetical protein